MLAVAACGGGSGEAQADTTAAADTAAPAPALEAATAGVRLARVRGGLGDALFITGAPGQPGRLFVVQQGGRIRILQNGRLLGRPFLDVSRLIAAGGEQGLLGLAFHPDYARNGRFYVDYTNRAGDTRVVEYRRASATRAEPCQRARVLLGVDQPFANHNGGALAFGPDGDAVHRHRRRRQRRRPARATARTRTRCSASCCASTWTAAAAGAPTASRPATRSPTAAAGRRSTPTACATRGASRSTAPAAISGSATSARAPSRRSTTGPRDTGAGTNFGWRAFEGRSVHIGGAQALEGPARQTPPVAQYTHAQGCSVTGGYVYRGTKVPALQGRYVYADFCSGTVWSMRAGPNPGDVRRETGLGARLSNVTSFGESLNGDLYVIAGGSLYRFVRG